MHQKCFNYALINLLFSLCRSIWIIDSLVIHPNLHFRALARLFYPQSATNYEMYPNSFFSVIFAFGFTFESFKEFWGASICMPYVKYNTFIWKSARLLGFTFLKKKFAFRIMIFFTSPTSISKASIIIRYYHVSQQHILGTLWSIKKTTIVFFNYVYNYFITKITM